MCTKELHAVQPVAGAQTFRLGSQLPILVLTALFFLAGEASAQTDHAVVGNDRYAGGTMVPLPAGADGDRSSNMIARLLSSAAVPTTYSVFDSLGNAFSYYSFGAEPLDYDPASNALVTIKRGRPGDISSLYIRVSTDLGQTWGAPIGPLHDTMAIGKGRYPSLKIINPTGSADPSGLIFYYTYPILDADGDGFSRFATGIVTAAGTHLAPDVVDVGLGGETWGTDAKTVLSKSNDVLITAGTLTRNNIGLRRFDVIARTVTADVPEAWQSPVFVPSGNDTTRTSTVVGMGRDDNNAFYLGAFARFPELEGAGKRARPSPAVSRSTDKGLTWSSFSVMPTEVLIAFLREENPGANPDSVSFLYSTPDDFIVTGNNQFSFALNLLEGDDSRAEEERMNMFVEVYFDGTTWGMRMIGDWTARFFNYRQPPQTDTSNVTQNELQLAMTADGKKLVAKWMDLQDYELDAGNIRTSDIFMSARDLPSGSWSTPINVTETPIYDRLSWIPNTLPNDLSQVPILTVQSVPLEEGAAMGDSLLGNQLDIGKTQHLISILADISSIASVQENEVVTASGIRLEALQPNPASADATIALSLRSRGMISVDVWTISGEKIMGIYSGMMEAGEKTLQLKSAILPAGSYYLTLSSNGERVGRIFTVSR